MAAGAILPPLFFERRRHASLFAPGRAFSGTPQKKHDTRKTRRPKNATPKKHSVDHAVGRPAHGCPVPATGHRKDILDMANTTSAKKATRKIARRTVINKSRRTQMRGSVRIVEEAIKSGDRDAALKAMARAEPELMQAAQRNIIHKNNASRKVSRLAHQIAKLAK
jgi:small subunit ribosomal protein S20